MNTSYSPLARVTSLVFVAILMALSASTANADVLHVDSDVYIVSGNETYGSGSSSDAVTLGNGTLVVDSGATLTLRGHLNLQHEGAEVHIRAGGAILFDSAAGQTLQFILGAENQIVRFEGTAESRARIANASGARGHYYFSLPTYARDARFSGSYGLIEDANDPTTGTAWSMNMSNSAHQSKFVADHIEFRRCGRVKILGYDAGNDTEVALSNLTFRDSLSSPTFWFDGFANNTTTAALNATNKSLTHIVADEAIWLRFVTGYTLDHFVIDSDSGGGLRINAERGMAKSHSQVFVASRKGGSGMNLIAYETDQSYLYMEGDNPHGWTTKGMTGDAALTNYWFEVNHHNASDTGDAVLTNGAPLFKAGLPHRLTIRNCGVIPSESDNRDANTATLITLNDASGLEFVVDHCVTRIRANSQAIAFDEGAATPAGTGVSVSNSVFLAEPGATNAFAIGSARGAHTTVIARDPFLSINNNLYGHLTDGGGTVHAASFSAAIDQQSKFETPSFVDSSVNLRRWDASLSGGAGTVRHAIAEMMKLNDADFDPRYTVANLISYMRGGYTITTPDAVDASGQPWGPSVVGNPPPEQPSPELPPVEDDIVWVNAGAGELAINAHELTTQGPTNTGSAYATQPLVSPVDGDVSFTVGSNSGNVVFGLFSDDESRVPEIDTSRYTMALNAASASGCGVVTPPCRLAEMFVNKQWKAQTAYSAGDQLTIRFADGDVQFLHVRNNTESKVFGISASARQPDLKLGILLSSRLSTGEQTKITGVTISNGEDDVEDPLPVSVGAVVWETHSNNVALDVATGGFTAQAPLPQYLSLISQQTEERPLELRIRAPAPITCDSGEICNVQIGLQYGDQSPANSDDLHHYLSFNQPLRDGRVFVEFKVQGGALNGYLTEKFYAIDDVFRIVIGSDNKARYYQGAASEKPIAIADAPSRADTSANVRAVAFISNRGSINGAELSGAASEPPPSEAE